MDLIKDADALLLFLDEQLVANKVALGKGCQRGPLLQHELEHLEDGGFALADEAESPAKGDCGQSPPVAAEALLMPTR
ncbi:MAG: hypothetical protein ABSH34_25325 [Verrucomicrobiota bacterium]